MNVDAIHLSDFAQVDGSGKLSVIGCFNVMGGEGPVWGLPVLYLSMIIHGHHSEAAKKHSAEVRLLNDKREILNTEPIAFEFTFARHAAGIGDGVPLRHVVAISLFGVQFKQPGAYAFEVYLDGVYHAAASLFVMQGRPGRPGGGGPRA